MEYFYHCSINTFDILTAGILKKSEGGTVHNGLSLLYANGGTHPIYEAHRYYRAPDNINPNRRGDSGVYPIKAAFCLSLEIANEKFSKRYNDAKLIHESHGLLLKGGTEHIYPTDFNLNNNPKLIGLRIPRDEEDSLASFYRLIIALHILDKKNIKVAYGNNFFMPAHKYIASVADIMRYVEVGAEINNDLLLKLRDYSNAMANTCKGSSAGLEKIVFFLETAERILTNIRYRSDSVHTELQGVVGMFLRNNGSPMTLDLPGKHQALAKDFIALIDATPMSILLNWDEAESLLKRLVAAVENTLP